MLVIVKRFLLEQNEISLLDAGGFISLCVERTGAHWQTNSQGGTNRILKLNVMYLFMKIPFPLQVIN